MNIKNLSLAFMAAGVASIPLAIGFWNYGPEIGPEVIKGVTDAGLQAALNTAHKERWGIFVGLWAPTLLLLGLIADRFAERGLRAG